MFLLHFLPDSFIQFLIDMVLLSGAGLTAFGILIAKWIPYIRNIRKLLTAVGVVLLVAGAYWKGGYGVEMEWRLRVEELQAKIDAADAKSKETNVVIQEKVVTKVKHIKDTQVRIQQQIVERESAINGECVVPADAIEMLNKAAEKPVLGEVK
jgi:hypothetical protein